MQKILSKPESLTDKPFTYCPGCTHGIIHRLVAETMDELGIRESTVGVAPVGCSVFAYEFFKCDMIQAAHGRAPAVAVGVKRTNPDLTVFTYQGDGDLAAIGTAEIVHAAVRGDNITAIFVNNAIYGMTGGQMAPTTLEGQKTQTTPFGRDLKMAGHPIKMSEMLATLDAPSYIARVSTHNPAHVRKAKQAIKKAFENQVQGKGFAMVEVLSTCPSNWGMDVMESMEWLEKNMLPYYKLGEFKNV
ncbi:MAG: thiamine pyrophosphate-dependent enzyme [Armatimonadota bacterium]